MDQVQSKSININTYKVKANWTREMAEDLKSFHSLNVEKVFQTEILKEGRKFKIKSILERSLM